MSIKYYREIETDKNTKYFDQEQKKIVSLYDINPIQSLIETYSKTSGKPYIITRCIFTRGMKFPSNTTYDKSCINSFVNPKSRNLYYLVKKQNSSDNKLYIVKKENLCNITNSSLFTINIIDKIDINTYDIEIFNHNKFVHVGQIEIEEDNFFF